LYEESIDTGRHFDQNPFYAPEFLTFANNGNFTAGQTHLNSLNEASLRIFSHVSYLFHYVEYDVCGGVTLLSSRKKSDCGDVLLGQPLFCVPQRIGIYVGWVDVKGSLIMPALRKSTHHSKESTGKQIKSIYLSFWWVGYFNMVIG